MIEPVKHISKNYGIDRSWTLEVYERTRGYQAARKALSMEPAKIIDEMKAANIRGRGGAGFPMGIKWSFMRPHPTKPAYLVVNADEGEPGTHKDRTIMELDPHRLLEGCMIGMYAYIYVRDELHLSKKRLWDAIHELRAKGYLGKRPFGLKDYPLEIHVQTGAGAYICGEETALLNSLEGRRGEPRLKPPFPAQVGAFGCPTTVNNVESIASAGLALMMGGAEFSKLSRLHEVGDGGCRLYGVNGHVEKGLVVELPCGPSINELIAMAGGVSKGRKVKGVIPGGSSCPVLTPDEVFHMPDEKSPLHKYHGMKVFDVPMGVDTMRIAGTMLGTCCITVIAEGTCMVRAAHNLARFYKHESCGQCTPCREGTGWIERIFEKIETGHGDLGELNEVSDIASNIIGNTICAFGDGAALPMLGFVRKFRKEFEQHVKDKRCPFNGSIL
ncbi:MAG: NADH-quinone oxidoreductase subunit NuoF [Deltaproteobacteria bacterium]|nr:NADH-quinone oxidoreductase subunit NuoF [Deltaproteobacteria bacterium]